MNRACALAAAVVALVAGCTASHGSPPATADPQPLREPYLVMSGPQAGVLVWPSGANWLLLSTTDGFRHVADRTPPAVDTGGGLAVAVDGARVAAGIGAIERLVRSPLVTADRSWRWQPGEIPGAMAAARHSLALGGATTTYVVLHDGRVTALEHGHWTTLTSAAQLGRGFRPDTVSAQGPHDLVVTGHGEVGRPAGYRSTDDGRHWHGRAGHGRFVRRRPRAVRDPGRTGRPGAGRVRAPSRGRARRLVRSAGARRRGPDHAGLRGRHGVAGRRERPGRGVDGRGAALVGARPGT